jgi:ubiquinone/menaquinone biosynthesis C-methylase UbiE
MGVIRAALPLLLGAALAACAPADPPSAGTAPVGREPGASRGELFSPDDLGVLEGPDRDEWQQPERVMDALAIADGARVADVGAGGGWFTVRLAHRVGPNGVVFAEDIQPEMIDAIDRRVRREQLANVQTVLGTSTDPMLPDDLQAVLIVDAYPQFDEPVLMLREVAAALAPNGRLGIVDFTKEGAGGPGPPIADRLDPEQIIRDAVRAGLTLERHETFLRYQYLLVFVKPRTGP